MNIWSKVRGAFRKRAVQGAQPDASDTEASDTEGTGVIPTGPVPLLPPPSGDQAVESRAKDRLGRAPLAAAIAAQLAATDPETGVVFGVTGPWGSGKTSLLRMTKEALEQDHGGFMVLWFNPWLFTGTEQVMGVFFTELGAQLSDLSGAEWDELGATMQAFGATLSRLRTVPAAGGAAAAGGATISAGGGRMRGAADEGSSLHERRRRLEGALRRAWERDGRRLVIVVDDLDRLRRQEIRDLVALVKLNADLPNLHFVLAYDRERVEQALGEAEGDGRAYLEKIVQVAYDVPKSRDVDLSQELIDAVNDALGHAPVTGPFDEHRFRSILRGIILPLIGSVRDVRRYANALPVALRVVGDEVALEDVLALEAIRVLLPEAFATLASSADALTTPYDQLGVTHRSADSRAEEAKTKVEAFVGSGSKERITREARSSLFPASLWIENSHYGSDWQKGWSKGRLVAHPRVLNFYLEKRLPEGVLPAREVQELFEALGDDERLRALLDALDPDALEHAMERLLDYEDDCRPADAEKAVPILLNQMSRLREGSNWFGDLGADIKLEKVVLRLLRKVEDRGTVATLVKTVSPRIETLSAREALVNIVGHTQNAGHKLVTAEEGSLLEAQLLTAMEQAAPQDFARERNLVSLLRLARKIDPEKGGEFVRQLAKRDEVFLAVVRRLRRETHSVTAGDFVSRANEEFDWSTLGDLFGEETARRRVDELSRSVGSRASGDGFDEQTLAALRLAEDYATGRR
ncbi:MAG TPA: P-loop NTPase fold protein [Rubrobacteraceae bacterium]|nr:P-loop NTPase fold protein [Rubrobacteraceae bacterium]